MERDKAFLFLIIGKGGVGKTLLARAIDGLYREEDQPFVGIDADLSNASYHRFSNRAIPIDVGAPEVTSWIESHVLKHLIDTEGMNMIIDTGAGTERNVRAWLADNDVVSILRARNIDVVIFTVFDTSVDSITPFLENIDMLPSARHVLVFNEGLTRGLPRSKAFKNIESEREFIEQAKGKPRVYMPALIDAQQIDGTDYPIYDSQATGSALARNPMFVRRMQLWKRSMYEQVRRVLDGDTSDAEHIKSAV
jgi:MinD-like ATPase involved in chromosome partitioning or flagellar assembly